MQLNFENSIPNEVKALFFELKWFVIGLSLGAPFLILLFYGNALVNYSGGTILALGFLGVAVLAVFALLLNYKILVGLMLDHPKRAGFDRGFGRFVVFCILVGSICGLAIFAIVTILGRILENGILSESISLSDFALWKFLIDPVLTLIWSIFAALLATLFPAVIIEHNDSIWDAFKRIKSQFSYVFIRVLGMLAVGGVCYIAHAVFAGMVSYLLLQSNLVGVGMIFFVFASSGITVFISTVLSIANWVIVCRALVRADFGHVGEAELVMPYMSHPVFADVKQLR